MRSWRWARLERLILRSAPIITVPFGSQPAECELHLLTWSRDWRQAIWAAKSFYHFSRVNWPLAFHDGGGLSSALQAELHRHFPHARIFGGEESDRIVEKYLAEKGFDNLLRARRRLVLVRKITDVVLLAAAPKILLMDPDVLFFGPPEELIRLGRLDLTQIVFLRDYQDAYSIEKSQARQWFGLDLPERINTGLGIIPVRLVDFTFLNELLAPDRIPVDRDLWGEQTAWALQAARAGLAYLPGEYKTELGLLDLEKLGIVSRHYVGSVRHLYFEEGLPFVLRGNGIFTSRHSPTDSNPGNANAVAR